MMVLHLDEQRIICLAVGSNSQFLGGFAISYERASCLDECVCDRMAFGCRFVQ